jgi:hypothetical protein
MVEQFTVYLCVGCQSMVEHVYSASLSWPDSHQIIMENTQTFL